MTSADAVLALLGDDDPRPQAEHVAGGRDEVGLPGQLAQLLVVEDQAVDERDHLEQLVARDVDPQVHRIEGDEPRVGALLADLELEPRLDVGQKQHLGRAGRRRQLGLEVLEHVELGVQRLTGVEVPAVAALPEERLAARDALDVVDRRTARSQHLELGLTEVVADRPDDPHMIEERGGQGEVGRGPAQHPLADAERRLHSVERDRTYDGDAHGRPEASGSARCLTRRAAA